MKFISYNRCSTCRKAEKFLIDNDIVFTKRDIKNENPTYEELKNWYDKFKVSINKMFNTHGIKYKELNLKNKLKDMTDDEKLKLLATDGMLVKRPILSNDDEILFGFKEEEYKNFINHKKD